MHWPQKLSAEQELQFGTIRESQMTQAVLLVEGTYASEQEEHWLALEQFKQLVMAHSVQPPAPSRVKLVLHSAQMLASTHNLQLLTLQAKPHSGPLGVLTSSYGELQASQTLVSEQARQFGVVQF